MTKETEEQRAMKIVKKGKRVKVDTSGFTSSVISVRLSHDVLRDLELEAEKQNIGITTYARLAIEEKLALTETEKLSRMAQVFSSLAHQFDQLHTSETRSSDSKAS